jgi:hypothetical protein
MEVLPAPLPAGAGGRAGGPSVHEAELFFPGFEGVLGVFQEAADGFPDEGRDGRPPAAGEAAEGPDLIFFQVYLCKAHG